ncbi:MAG: hypothetical protein J6R89_08375 [Clostridia bacterium]|nr:hypothetical protein [Clostridia bacterium]
MIFCKAKSIENVWANIRKHEGEIFYTVRNIAYNYVVKENYILINNDPRRRITKETLEKALKITNPTPSKINMRGQSYIYGIITDCRIV